MMNGVRAIGPARQIVVEHRRLPAPYAIRPDDRARLRAVVATMRNVPRESTASMPDMLFLLRRLAGTLDRIARDLEQVTQEPVQMQRRLPGSKPREIAEASFAKRDGSLANGGSNC